MYDVKDKDGRSAKREVTFAEEILISKRSLSQPLGTRSLSLPLGTPPFFYLIVFLYLVMSLRLVLGIITQARLTKRSLNTREQGFPPSGPPLWTAHQPSHGPPSVTWLPTDDD